MQSFSPPSSPPSDGSAQKSTPHLSILLLSASDGRRTLVDLTKTLAEMSQKSKLAPEDISAELIDAELTESVMGEPDLLLLFGDSVVLQGYPPWQVRLTEILCVPTPSSVPCEISPHTFSYTMMLTVPQQLCAGQQRRWIPSIPARTSQICWRAEEIRIVMTARWRCSGSHCRDTDLPSDV